MFTPFARSLLQALASRDFAVHSRRNEGRIPLSETQFRELCTLYAANRLEQLPRWPKKWRVREAEEMRLMRAFLDPAAGRALSRAYHFDDELPSHEQSACAKKAIGTLKLNSA